MHFIEDVPDHVLAMRVDKVMSAQDVAAAVRQIDDKLARHPRIGLVADLTQLGLLTPGAILEDFAAQLRYLGKWHRFPKVAVLIEDSLLKSVTNIVARIVPQVEIRTFRPDQREEAVAFAGTVQG